MMKKIFIIITIVLSAFTSTLNGQNLDPTVSVTRTYKADLVEANKPNFKMNVPDSVEQFKLRFDYSIFDAPYKGAYEFKPYLLNMKPSSAYDSEKEFYLNIGAGYSLYPELDVIYTPKIGNKFRTTVYGHHRSYFGDYRAVGFADDYKIKTSKKDGFKGYETHSTAGVNGRYDWRRGLLHFDLSYLGIAAKDTSIVRSYDGAEFKLRLCSKNNGKRYFYYDTFFSYRFAEDKFEPYSLSKQYIHEHNIDLSTDFGYSYKYSHRLLLDVDFEYNKYSHLEDITMGNISFTPNYEYKQGRWNIDAGVAFAFIIRDKDASLDAAKGQVIYPDVKINFAILENHLNLFLNATGGNKLNAYADFIDKNHHFSPLYSIDEIPGVSRSFSDKLLCDNTVESVNLAGGINGNIATKFLYDIRGGYINYSNAPLDALVFLPVATQSFGGASGNLFPTVSYSGYEMSFVSADLQWKSQDVDIHGNFTYKNTDIVNKSDLIGFEPARFSTSLDAIYNWNERIYVGLECDYVGARRGKVSKLSTMDAMYTLPYFVDLDLKFEYRFNNSMSLWLRGGNLLDMPVQYNLGYVEKGINFTVGFCLNL